MIGNHFGGLGGLLASFLPQQYPQMMGQGLMMHGGTQQPVQPFGGPAQMFRPVAYASSDGADGNFDYTVKDPELDAYLESNLDGASPPPPPRRTAAADIDHIMARSERQQRYAELRMQATNDYRYNRISKEEYQRRLDEIERGYGDPER